jgi:hypothetical protein
MFHLCYDRYTVSTDNVIALRALDGKTIKIGEFTSFEPGLSQIMCRGVGPIKTPDGEAYSAFIRKALVDELRMANIYSDDALCTLTGHLDLIKFDSTTGIWNIALTVKSSNGRSMDIKEEYKYTTSWYGETACNQTAQALVPAVQNLVGKIVRSPDFVILISN